jgi:DNA-directed RNA polymerase subunit RPC12/RpoP
LAATRDLHRKASIYVKCPTCSCEIRVHNSRNLPREFSVACPNCQGRKLYQVAQVHEQELQAEIAQKFGTVQFGMKDAIPTSR